MMRILIGFACVGAIAASSASAATFYQHGVVNLAPLTAGTAENDIGTHPSAVAWDGTTAYVAGYNAGTSGRDIGIVAVANARTSPTIGSRFGTIFFSAANSGYVGADFKAGAGIATSFDGGAAATAIRLDGAGGDALFQTMTAVRPVSGPAFDPTTGQLGYLVNASHSVRNLNVPAGTSAGSTATNLATASAATTYRDLDFDSAGNLYARNNNDVVRANRTNATTYNATASMLANLTDANLAGQNLAVIEGFPTAGDATFAIYNDRTTAAAGQAFAGVVKAVRANGTAEPLSFLGADGVTPVSFAAGNGQYDFAYHDASKTLALLDYANKQLYLFAAVAVPEPTSLAALAAAATLGLRRRRR